MCYDTVQLAYRIYKEAVRLNATKDEIEHLKEKWERIKEVEFDYYHAAGFAHPKLGAFTLREDKIDINLYRWGLIPDWIKNEEQAIQIQNKTINARVETIFEKPSFKKAALKGRCIIPLDGFFEHYHKDGKSYPFFIHSKEERRLLVGGLSSSWINKETGEIIDSCSIVTTHANDLLSIIHNNPKVKEPRMPLILSNENASIWLRGEQDDVMKIIKANNKDKLEAWPVHKLRGKDYIGNKKEILEKVEYKELEDLELI